MNTINSIAIDVSINKTVHFIALLYNNTNMHQNNIVKYVSM